MQSILIMVNSILTQSKNNVKSVTKQLNWFKDIQMGGDFKFFCCTRHQSLTYVKWDEIDSVSFALLNFNPPTDNCSNHKLQQFL